MDQFLQQYGFLLLMGALLVAMMVFSSRSRKKMMAQQAERERQLQEEMVPGVWVKTAFGFWGRFVDMDGDVVVLETADGTETYWDRAVVREVGTPPFASEHAEAEDQDSVDDDDEPVLGLDNPSDSKN